MVKNINAVDAISELTIENDGQTAEIDFENQLLGIVKIAVDDRKVMIEDRDQEVIEAQQVLCRYFHKELFFFSRFHFNVFPQRRSLQKKKEAKEKEQILERLKTLSEAATTQLELLSDILPPNMVSSLMNSEKVL